MSSCDSFNTKNERPFLKWAGGKQQILRQILDLLPRDYQTRYYREPFLGGGAVFFGIAPTKAFLSDANQHLIMCFEQVRDNPLAVADYLRIHDKMNCEKYYYEIRDIYNTRKCSAAQAARFIYLNRAGYNGVFRVNTQGLYNVPYGKRKRLALPSRTQLRNAARLLKTAEIKACSFREALENTGPRDFVYLDPPYPPINGTSYFTHYTKDRFAHADQIEVAKTVRMLHSRGSKFMLSNADTEQIRGLYRGFNLVSLPVTRFITCKKTRHCVKELIITNY